MEKTRLNKFISHNTNYSRREADELIKAGKVSIAGRVVSDLATSVDEDDKVRINGRLIKLKKEFTVIVYHKQKGELVSKKDDRGRKTIYDTLDKKFAKSSKYRGYPAKHRDVSLYDKRAKDIF